MLGMVARRNIARFAEEIARAFSPQKILLFGSYANGRPAEDSDVDLLVIMHHTGQGAEQAARIRQTIRPGFPLDLIVRTPEKVCSRCQPLNYKIGSKTASQDVPGGI